MEGLHFGAGRGDNVYTVNSNRKAKELCNGCPVFEQCLTACFEFREEYGVWAGTTRKERISIFKDIAEGLLTEAQAVSILLSRRRNGRKRR